jgi:anti-anti-sigma factor
MHAADDALAHTPFLVELEGEFDASIAADARLRFETLANETQDDVVLDLAAVRFIDSSGVGAIVFLIKRLRARGRKLVIRNASGQPADLLKMLRVHLAVEWQQQA